MYRKHPMDQKKVPQTGAMELYPRDTDDMRVVLETGHVRRKTSATGVTWKWKLIGLRSTGELFFDFAAFREQCPQAT